MSIKARRSMVVVRSLAWGAAVVLALGVTASSVKGRATGAVSLTALGVAVTQSFDTLITSGTTTWVNDSTLPGWYHARTGNGTGIVANNGGLNAGNLYSYGTGTSTDRALGSVGSGNAAAGNFHYGVRLANETGATITSLEVSYVGEQWRNGGNLDTNTVEFSYRIGTGLGSLLTDFTTSGVAVSQLNFTSPITGSTGTSLDGNAAANRVIISHTITGLSLPPGAEILLRWADVDHGGADHGLAIDEFSITANGDSSGQPTLSIDDVAVMEGNSGTVTATFTVSLSSSAHSGVTFDIETADGGAPNPATTSDNDYVARALFQQVIPAGQSSFTFDVTVNGDLNVEANEQFFVTVGNVLGAAIADGIGNGTITNDDQPPPVVSDVVISQVYGGGGNAGATLTHDFIELFNAGTTDVSLAGWSVQYLSATGTGTWAVTPLSGSIAAGRYYLVRQAQGTGGSVALPAPDAEGSIALAAGAGKVALVQTTTALTGCPPGGLVDLVGYGATANCFEGTRAPAPENATAVLRKRAGCFDSDNNGVDFSVGGPNPRNLATAAKSCTFSAAAIREIQGSGLETPLLGSDVVTTGIVTAKKANGFFLQTPDASVDNDPATSEALFVFTASVPAVAVGDAASVRGTASEFFGLTQLESTLPGDIAVDSSGNALPVPVALDATFLDPNGSLAQLEPLEAMRVRADSLISVAPTNDFGEIYTVLLGVPRPLREPGIEISQPVPPDPTTGVPDCCIPRFDQNPERVAIDTDGLLGSTAIAVTSNVAFGNVTGPLDFTFGEYKILPESAPTISANMTAIPVPVPAADELTVAGFNIENFANGETQRRKAALAIRTLLHSPDVVGVIEILDLPSLQALAAQINGDAVSAGEANPGYEARLVQAPAGGTQNVGFLVKTSRVQIDSVSQELAGQTFINPVNGAQETLHDRPPLVLRAQATLPDQTPRPIIIVVNHTRSFIDVELVSGEGRRVRAKRTAQAEAIAVLLQQLQTDNPSTPILAIGDYNAYQFNDGYTDPMAILKGTPTPDDQIVVDGSPDLVNPDFVNLTDTLPPGERYSFIFEGNPQAIDHMLVNTVAAPLVRRYAIARSNADFPQQGFAADPTRPEGNSDHDMPVAYLALPCAANASAQVTITRGGFALNRTTNRFQQVVTLRNDGAAVAGPVSLVLDALSSNATLFNQSGDTSCAAPGGSPFIDISVGADNVFSTDETITVTLQFANPTRAGISYATRVLAGPAPR